MVAGKTRNDRLGIAGLMTLVLGIAIGLAALRNANRWWASGTYTAAISAVALAILLAAISSGRSRSVSTGFAVFGLTYLLSDSRPPRVVNGFGMGPQSHPRFIVEQAFTLLQPHLKPMPQGSMQDFIHYDQVSHALAILLFGVLGAVLARFAAKRRDTREAEASPDRQETEGGR
jgi:hypothetical protein